MDIINLHFPLFIHKILSLGVTDVQILPLSSNSRKEIMEETLGKIIENLKKNILIENDWFTEPELNNLWAKNIDNCIKECDCPEKDKIFNAFDGLKPQDVKVLIIGQDPYPKKGRADGLAFSFGNNETAKDSLKNILEKIKEELNIHYNEKISNLTCWRDRGVLLLNTALTYKKGNKDYHIESWSKFVNTIISKLLQIERDSNNPLVIMLWGGQANLLTSFRNDLEDANLRNKHIYILRASHPSNLVKSKKYSGIFKSVAKKLRCKPLTKNVKGFMDNSNKIFIECNKILKSNKIDWSTD